MTKEINKNNIHVLETPDKTTAAPTDDGFRRFSVMHVLQRTKDTETLDVTNVEGYMSLDPTTGMVGFADARDSKSISFMIPMHSVVSISATEVKRDTSTG